MTRPPIRSLVSLAAALTVTVTLGGCASAPPSRLTGDEPAPTVGSPLTVRFDNDATDYVDLYLVDSQHDWLLGRVQPGARATLRIPEAALAGKAGPVRLAVVTGGRMRSRQGDDVRAPITIAQTAAAIASQWWTFSQTPASGQLTAVPRARSLTEVGRP